MWPPGLLVLRTGANLAAQLSFHHYHKFPASKLEENLGPAGH